MTRELLLPPLAARSLRKRRSCRGKWIGGEHVGGSFNYSDSFARTRRRFRTSHVSQNQSPSGMSGTP